MATGRSPAAVVEHLFRETEAGYYLALRRNLLDYDLRSDDQRMHHGIELHAIDSSRYVRSAPSTSERLGIRRAAVALAGRRLSKRLFVTEPLQQQLINIWFEPTTGFCRSRMVPVLESEFRSALPVALDEFLQTMRESVDN